MIARSNNKNQHGHSYETNSKTINLNFPGKRFGLLTVIKKTDERIFGCIAWLCHCDCGVEKVVSGRLLLDGRVRSCGCLRHRGQVFLYLLYSHRFNLFKIGVSNNPRKRRQDLKVTLSDSIDLLAYKPATTADEKDILKDLDLYRIKHPNSKNAREWFKNKEDVFEYISKVFNIDPNTMIKERLYVRGLRVSKLVGDAS